MITCKHSIYLPSKNTTGLFSEQIKYLSSSALAQGLTMVRTLSKEGGDQRNCNNMTNPDLPSGLSLCYFLMEGIPGYHITSLLPWSCGHFSVVLN